MIEKKETWRRVPSSPHIMASNLGRVMLVPYAGEKRKQCGGLPTFGYWEGHRFVFRVKEGKYKVHRLICEAFNGEPKDNQVCLHLDEDARNNKPSNLKWGTQKENMNFPKFKEKMSLIVRERAKSKQSQYA